MEQRSGYEWRQGRAGARPGAGDPAEAIALVARAKRDVLLRVHRRRLRAEDLEDCYSQATLELVVLARAGRPFSSRAHIANALEQRFLARVQDRRRALSGRSPIQAALEGAVPFEATEVRLELPDTRCEPERLVVARESLDELRKGCRALTADQRLVLASQLAQVSCPDFCRAHGWSAEKYRKVAQRARARLRELMSASDSGVD